MYGYTLAKKKVFKRKSHRTRKNDDVRLNQRIMDRWSNNFLLTFSSKKEHFTFAHNILPALLSVYKMPSRIVIKSYPKKSCTVAYFKEQSVTKLSLTDYQTFKKSKWHVNKKAPEGKNWFLYFFIFFFICSTKGRKNM